MVITNKKKLNFLEWNKSILINSLKKINLSIILILILDILFYLLSGYFAMFWLQGIQAKMAAFILPTDIISLGPEKAQQLVSDVRAFYYLIVVSFILLPIAIIFLASIFKGIIWAKTTNTKITFRLISGFLVLNLIWMGFWFVLIVLISLLVELSSAPMFMIATIILALYFTNALYAFFMKEQKLKAIISSVKLNITKIHLFLLPYTIIFLLFFIIIRIGNLLQFRYSAILLGLVIVIYAAIVRYYVSGLVMEIKEM